uniref:Putative secreted protein n=1 Tax=Anopheles marajoara TaxID=58244 RepID=A0A2M4CC39_9DIPT
MFVKVELLDWLIYLSAVFTKQIAGKNCTSSQHQKRIQNTLSTSKLHTRCHKTHSGSPYDQTQSLKVVRFTRFITGNE